MTVLLANTAFGRTESGGGGVGFPHGIRKGECGRDWLGEQVDEDGELLSSELGTSEWFPSTSIPHPRFLVRRVLKHSCLIGRSGVKRG